MKLELWLMATSVFVSLFLICMIINLLRGSNK